MALDLFAKLSLVDVHDDVFRNIVSIKSSQDLFDDLSDDPSAWRVAQAVENEVKPPLYQSQQPIIDRPFEDAAWFNAIAWPFQHWSESRYSTGRFGVWYGCDTLETSVYETVHHWYYGFLSDAGFTSEAVVGERKVYAVRCDAALIDLRLRARQYPALCSKTDYSFTQSVGQRVHFEGHPGLVTPSVRRLTGHNYVVMNPHVLSNPRHYCQLRYSLQDNHIQVEQTIGEIWLDIPVID